MMLAHFMDGKVLETFHVLLKVTKVMGGVPRLLTLNPSFFPLLGFPLPLPLFQCKQGEHPSLIQNILQSPWTQP